MVTKTGESCCHVRCSSLYTHTTKTLDMPVLQQTHLLWLRVATPNCFDFVICCILQLRSFLFSLSPVIISRMLYSLSPHDLVIDIGFAIAKSVDRKKIYWFNAWEIKICCIPCCMLACACRSPTAALQQPTREGIAVSGFLQLMSM